MATPAFVFKKGKDKAEQDAAEGSARWGGMVRTPDYFDVYLLAAGQLIERAEHDNRLDEMAVPCFYLQRHTLELAIKELIKRLHRLDYGDVVLKMVREKLDHRALYERKSSQLWSYGYAASR